MGTNLSGTKGQSVHISIILTYIYVESKGGHHKKKHIFFWALHGKAGGFHAHRVAQPALALQPGGEEMERE